VFATEAEALASAKELMSRWMSVTGVRAVPSTDKVNYSLAPVTSGYGRAGRLFLDQKFIMIGNRDGPS
jgi:hypothetical protein